MRDSVLVITFAIIAIIVAIAWLVVLFTRPDLVAGVTVVLTAIIGGVTTMATKVRQAETVEDA